MAPGEKVAETATRGRKGRLIAFVCLLNLSSFLAPVSGYAVACKISHNVAECNSMKLSSVPQNILSTVKVFDLYRNKISRIYATDFVNVTLLEELDLHHNFISQMDKGAFANLALLKKLSLSNNKLVVLGEDVFQGLRNLTELRLTSNRIRAVAPTSFRTMENLTILDLRHNKLQRIANIRLILQHLPRLLELYLQNNGLTTFHSWELTNSSVGLKYLDLSQNALTNFQITADVFPNLTWFNVGGAQTRKLMKWNVQNRTFFSRVTTLDMSALRMTFKDMTTLLETVNSSLATLRMNAMKRDLEALINTSCSIPSLSALQIRKNRLYTVTAKTFTLCVSIDDLDLAENHLATVELTGFTALQSLRTLGLNINNLSSVPAAIRNLSNLRELDVSRNKITNLECEDFAGLPKLRRLYLYYNQLSALKHCVFKDLIRLQILKLQSNQIKTLNGAFKTNLPNLSQLQLNGNILTVIATKEFSGLPSLQNLSLYENQIVELRRACFLGLSNLTDILLQGNQIKETQLNTGVFNDLINLRRLDIRNNHIKYGNSSSLPRAPFSQLSRLELLQLPDQHGKGSSRLPSNFLQGLTNLLILDVKNIQLHHLHEHMFNDTPRLEKLDMSSNELRDLSPHLFSKLPNLKRLYISRASLRSLDDLTKANLTKLVFLQARRNMYSIIHEETIKSLPALVFANFEGNSFTCSCDNAWFIKWVKDNNQTQVFDAYNFECNYPTNLKGKKLLHMDISFCEADLEFILYISTTCLTLTFMLSSFVYHFLRLHLKYAYYLFLALLFDKKHRNKPPTNQYDAFISYNADDEPWVVEELVPKLEGEQGWKLCLHHRDFIPGKPIVDNIIDAIYGSRKTICVISRRYLQSEWCSREMQVASFRLFDEQKDVLILVFLEEVGTAELSPYHRMRRLLKRRSYLSWTRGAEHPDLFWEKVRQALAAGDQPADDNFRLTIVDNP